MVTGYQKERKSAMGRGKHFRTLIEQLDGTYKHPSGTSKSHTHKTKLQRAHFIAWDGEGIDDTKHPPIDYVDEKTGEARHTEHQLYALLMNNEGVCEIDTNGLSTERCLMTLLTSTEDKHAIHVCFGASYDINMMLRDIPREKLIQLHKGKKIDYKQFRLSYRPRKCLELWEYESKGTNWKKDKKGNWIRAYKRSMILWDVLGFFQGSFVETLKKYFVSGNQLPVVQEKYKTIIEKIKEGKTRRGTFTKEELETFVQPYCKLEVDALEELMQTLRAYLIDTDMLVARWDGAGACAAAIFKKYGVKEHLKEEYLPPEVVQAAEYAFFGGRIETLRFGNYEGTIYHYDLNSAYPSAMQTLPSLKYGTWEHVASSDEPIKQYPDVSLFLISWKMPKNSTLCPFPWRNMKHTVYFPPIGKGWIWGPEVQAAVDCFPDLKLVIHEVWAFYPTHDCKPYSFIPDLYKKRQELVEQGNGAEKVIKLGLNSLYGKTAQSLGYADGKKPPYHNLVYAGMVTSITRAKLIRAGMQAPKSIIMFATDGIYSTSPLDLYCPREKELGAWEFTTHTYITIVASGVYFYGLEDGQENSFSRGFDRYTILRPLVIEAWKQGQTQLQCPCTRFFTLGSAVGTGNFDIWCTWGTAIRNLYLDMSHVAKRREYKKSKEPWKSLTPTYASCPDIFDILPVQFPFTHPFYMSRKYAFIWDDDTPEMDGIRARTFIEEQANTTS